MSPGLDTATRDRLSEMNGGYDERAYAFVLAALEEVVEGLPQRRHVTGRERPRDGRDDGGVERQPQDTRPRRGEHLGRQRRAHHARVLSDRAELHRSGVRARTAPTHQPMPASNDANPWRSDLVVTSWSAPAK